MGNAEDLNEVASYEIRVRGRLGALFLSSLPHRAVVRREGRWVVITRVADADLVDIAQKIVEHGVQVESVRELGD